MRTPLLLICILASVFLVDAQDSLSCCEHEINVNVDVLQEQMALVDTVMGPFDNDVADDNSLLAMHEKGEKAESMLSSMSTSKFNSDSSNLRLLAYEPHHGMDFRFFKSVTNPNTKPYTFMQDQTWTGIPVFLAGMIAKFEKKGFRQNYGIKNTMIRLVKYNFHSEVDNYTQFAPLVLTAGLHLAGVEGRSDWPRLLASGVMSGAVMAAFVNSIKYTTSEIRPDGTTRNSWPSGHTATAFMAATVLHKEYGMTRSPWYSVGGYAVATATGVMRVLNNRHWVSDVLSGAGIGILSTELGYGICDLLFKGCGLLRNDMSYHADLRSQSSFFSISMGIGLGNKNLVLPAFEFTLPSILQEDGEDEEVSSEPLQLKFRSATVVGAEGAYFFNPYIGIGGRLRVKATPIKGWSDFRISEEEGMNEFLTEDPDLAMMMGNVKLTILSDHITEFAADAGLYFSLPLSSRFALGTKLLLGRSIMDDIDINANYTGEQLDVDLMGEDHFKRNGRYTDYEWDYIDVGASNSMKFGTGLSLSYAHKNSFTWRVFCDYDYSRKTFKAVYNPFSLFAGVAPDAVELMKIFDWDVTQPAVSSAKKTLHQWVLGAALCVSF